MLGHLRNPNPGNPDELLRPQSLLAMSIMHTAWALHYRWGQFIRPNEPGRYLPGQMLPIIRANVQYNTRTIPLVTLNNIHEVKEDLYDMSGRWVLPASIMQQSKTQLLEYPTVPAQAMMLVRAIIALYIGKQTAWADRAVLERDVYKHLQGDCEHLVNDEILEEEMNEQLRTQVQPFIEDHEWYIHNVRFSGPDIIIERQGDYRAYQWTLIQHEKQRELLE